MTFSDNTCSEQIESLSAPCSSAECKSRIDNCFVSITESEGSLNPAIYQTVTAMPPSSDLGDEDALSLYSNQLRVGSFGRIPRYTSKSILTYNLDHGSFPSDADYRCVEKGIKRASDEWNKLQLGPKFQRISDNEKAWFKVIYHGAHPSNEGVYAKSFFPDWPARYREFIVYPLSLTDENRPFVFNISLHELGHILGFRHEFAGEHPHEQHIPSFLVGKKNPLSVMNYFDHPRMHSLTDVDKRDAHKFYDYNKIAFGNIRIFDVDAV